MTNTENDPTGAGWIISDDFFTHCDACGFDDGTHRPDCLRSYGVGDFANPNRPTPQGYCANGAHPTEFHYDDDGSCYLTPRPLTAYDQGIRDRAETVKALTDEQMRTALIYLSGAQDSWSTGAADPRWINAIAYALTRR